MNGDLCKEFLYHLDQDESMKVGNAPKKVEQWLEELGLPFELLRLLQWDWPQQDGFIGHIRILSSESIYKDEFTAPLLKEALFNAGSAPNGDLFVIDYSSDACCPGFVTHEEWSPWDEETLDARKYLQPIGRSLESLLYRICEGKYIPTDYYAAREFNAFLVEEEGRTR